MNKKDVMKYYIKDWIPHMDNFFRFFFPKKGKIINYNGSKILLKLDQGCSNWSLELIPKTKNNILTDNFNLLVWIRYENYSNINENPVGLKKIMNKELFSKKINWKDVYNFLDYIKSNCDYKSNVYKNKIKF
jgi:hypothetical protein